MRPTAFLRCSNGAYAGILSQPLGTEREATATALRRRGFGRDSVAYQPAKGLCSLTAIDEDWCLAVVRIVRTSSTDTATVVTLAVQTALLFLKF